MPDFPLNETIARSEATEAREFMKSPYNQAQKLTGVVESGNGTTAFKKIRSATLMSKLTSSNRYRPCNKSLANGAGAATTTVVVADTTNWYVGDAFFVNGVDSTETVDSITNSTTFELTGNATWADQDTLSSGDGTDTCAGILYRDVVTTKDFDANYDVIERREGGTIVVGNAIVRESSLIGDTTAAAADLASIIYD